VQIFSPATLHPNCVSAFGFFHPDHFCSYVARRYYAAIDNKGFKAIYAQFGVNGRSDEGSAPLFAQVHLRHMSGEQREFHGAGCCMNAEQFFNMVTHIPNVVEVLEKVMGVKVPKHILPVLALLNGDNDAASANAGTE